MWRGGNERGGGGAHHVVWSRRAFRGLPFPFSPRRPRHPPCTESLFKLEWGGGGLRGLSRGALATACVVDWRRACAPVREKKTCARAAQGSCGVTLARATGASARRPPSDRPRMQRRIPRRRPDRPSLPHQPPLDALIPALPRLPPVYPLFFPSPVLQAPCLLQLVCWVRCCAWPCVDEGVCREAASSWRLHLRVLHFGCAFLVGKEREGGFGNSHVPESAPTEEPPRPPPFSRSRANVWLTPPPPPRSR